MQTLSVAIRWSASRSRRGLGWTLLLAALGWLGALNSPGVARAEDDAEATFHRIGPTATVVEVSTGLPFAARVDTGATSCSIHCEAMEIEDPAADPRDNVGKPIRFLVKNKKGESEWIDSRIAGHTIVRTSERKDDRYKVELELRWQDVEKKVLVTLNDRQGMNYPVLIGRNFLRGDFLVDLTQNGGQK